MNAGRLILLVDDEQLIRNMLRNALEIRGYEVVDAGDGGEALGLFAKHQSRIAAVVTDITMPSVGGVELARRLAEKRPDIPILFMSGICDELANDLRAYACIQKPFSAPARRDRKNNCATKTPNSTRLAHLIFLAIAAVQ